MRNIELGAILGKVKRSWCYILHDWYGLGVILVNLVSNQRKVGVAGCKPSICAGRLGLDLGNVVY